MVAPVDEFTAGVNAAAAMLDKMADDYSAEHGMQDPDTGTMEFKRGAKEDHYNTLRELADDIRSIVLGNSPAQPVDAREPASPVVPPANTPFVRGMLTRSRRIVRLLEANEIVDTLRVIGVLRDMSDSLAYGDCSYWCPACYAEVSEPKHLAATPVVTAEREPVTVPPLTNEQVHDLWDEAMQDTVSYERPSLTVVPWAAIQAAILAKASAVLGQTLVLGAE